MTQKKDAYAPREFVTTVGTLLDDQVTVIIGWLLIKTEVEQTCRAQLNAGGIPSRFAVVDAAHINHRTRRHPTLAAGYVHMVHGHW
jgi:hypothetical protein